MLLLYNRFFCVLALLYRSENLVTLWLAVSRCWRDWRDICDCRETLGWIATRWSSSQTVERSSVESEQLQRAHSHQGAVFTATVDQQRERSQRFEDSLPTYAQGSFCRRLSMSLCECDQFQNCRSPRVKKPGFFLKSPTQWFFGFYWVLGFLLGFFGQAGKIGRIIQKLSNLKP